jgi:L-threonylcarbamoyladenylate synthase
MGSDQQQSSLEKTNGTVNSPGLRHRHYQPKARIVLVKDMVSPLRTAAEPAAFIGVSEPDDAPKFVRILVCQSVEEYASSLFDFFRQADQVGAKSVYCESVPEVGIGAALMDRLRRASES